MLLETKDDLRDVGRAFHHPSFANWIDFERLLRRYTPLNKYTARFDNNYLF